MCNNRQGGSKYKSCVHCLILSLMWVDLSLCPGVGFEGVCIAQDKSPTIFGVLDAKHVRYNEIIAMSDFNAGLRVLKTSNEDEIMNGLDNT